jgi:hypothetical protein
MRTPKIRYYLEAKNKDIDQRVKKELIMAEINYGYRVINKNGKARNVPFRISLQSTIKPNNFGLPEENYKFNEKVFNKFSKSNVTIKTKMNLLETAINKLTNNYLINSIIPQPDEFKNAIKLELGQVKLVEKEAQTILDFVYDKIKKDYDNLKIGQKKSIKEGTIKSYVTLSHHIENYQIATNDILKFSNFDEDKYWYFWKILNRIFKDEIKVKNPNQPRKQRKNKDGYTSNALQKQQKNFLKILKLAKKKNNLILDLEDETLLLEDSDAMKDFYVNEDELRVILCSDVSFNKKLQRAKEYAIISGLTGMRFESMSDAVNLKIQSCEESKYNFKFIHSRQNKTTTEVYIPLLKPICDIIYNHGGKFPKFPVSSAINNDLKELFSYLKISEEVVLTKVTYSNGTLVTKLPKSEAVSTHDFKGSFYSNLYKHKIKQFVIDNITHPDRKPKNAMAKIYNKTDMLDKAKMFVDEINKIESDIYKFE